MKDYVEKAIERMNESSDLLESVCQAVLGITNNTPLLRNVCISIDVYCGNEVTGHTFDDLVLSEGIERNREIYQKLKKVFSDVENEPEGTILNFHGFYFNHSTDLWIEFDKIYQ